MLKTTARRGPFAAAMTFLLAAPPALAIDGENVYRTTSMPVCMACHDTGAGGAPRINHPGDWGDRLGAGTDVMVDSVLDGKGAMPAYGSRLSEDEARAAVEYMLDTLD